MKTPTPADCVMTPIAGSSAIKAIGHHASSGTLFVEWHSGHTSRHDDPPWTDAKHQEFLAAKSKGGHFHAHVRDQHPGRAV